MWSQYDFEAIEALYEEVAEDYSDPNHQHGEHARVLLTATQNLHDTDTTLRHVHGDIIGDKHKMQLFYLRRGVRTLFSVYHAVKYHHYSAAYSRIRLLLELYLVVREMNRKQEETKQTFQDARYEIRENEYGPFDSLPFADYVDGLRRHLLGELTDEYESLDMLVGRLSDFGAHPTSIKTPQRELEHVDILEENILGFALMFTFGLAAQYTRTFEDTPIERAIREDMDTVFVAVLWQVGSLPEFFAEDLDFGSQIR
ncbi:hypothetical protein ACFQDD_00835 [Halorubrum pallidum]|uniref:Uncharacterized protein n=1 Tax=Halorubrum pallidum TaxID=1526114 RepID=A0ABD5T3G7_9EURY|nr:hypothetical protein [Halorubrum sp. LN27]